jgi:two-component system, NarL family, nitrate/nitrite response regulator NarL
MNVVIVDDSSLFRERFRELLNHIRNIEVIGEAVNGLKGLQLIEETRPDIAFIDIRMPEMNGIELLRKIRKLGFDVKICIMTNYPSKQYKDRCLKEGADFFFDKNLDIKLISDSISKLAANQKEK